MFRRKKKRQTRPCDICGHPAIWYPDPRPEALQALNPRPESVHRCPECTAARQRVIDSIDWERLAEGLGAFAQYLRMARQAADRTTDQ